MAFSAVCACVKISRMKTDVDKLLNKHQKLTHTDMMKVVSHVQRDSGKWVINTLMIEGIDVPFKYKRQKNYKNITGQRVNLTYYPDIETVAGMDMEVMNVVRIKIA
jgi:hypothetical protein